MWEGRWLPDLYIPEILYWHTFVFVDETILTRSNSSNSQVLVWRTWVEESTGLYFPAARWPGRGWRRRSLPSTSWSPRGGAPWADLPVRALVRRGSRGGRFRGATAIISKNTGWTQWCRISVTKVNRWAALKRSSSVTCKCDLCARAPTALQVNGCSNLPSACIRPGHLGGRSLLTSKARWMASGWWFTACTSISSDFWPQAPPPTPWQTIVPLTPRQLSSGWSSAHTWAFEQAFDSWNIWGRRKLARVAHRRVKTASLIRPCSHTLSWPSLLKPAHGYRGREVAFSTNGTTTHAHRGHGAVWPVGHLVLFQSCSIVSFSLLGDWRSNPNCQRYLLTTLKSVISNLDMLNKYEKLAVFSFHDHWPIGFIIKSNTNQLNHFCGLVECVC